MESTISIQQTAKEIVENYPEYAKDMVIKVLIMMEKDGDFSWRNYLNGYDDKLIESKKLTKK